MEHQEKEQAMPKLLYVYMKFQTFLKHIDAYLDGKAYFGDWSSMNDPMEGIPPRVQLEIKNEKVKKEFEAKLKECKICCLSERSDNFAMWSHYAERHTGVCIGFKVDNATLMQQDIEYAKIIYSDSMPLKKEYVPIIEAISKIEASGDIADSKTIENMKWQLVKKVLSHKFNDWSYEEEWRLMRLSSVPEMWSIGEIREIILGLECEQTLAKLKEHPCWGDLLPLIGKVKLEEKQGEIVFQLASPSVSLGMEYKVQKNGIAITKYTGTRREVDIPKIIAKTPVVTIGYLAFSNKRITSVSIPSSVTFIDDCAFATNELTSLIIPAGVTSIGEGAFCENKLENLEIPDSVIGIGERAFENNRLSCVAIPNSVRSIGYGAFEGNSLTSIIIGYNVEFGSSCFFSEADGEWHETEKDAFVYKGFSDFYKKNGKKAGMYTYNDGNWNFKAQ
jgi:hypothetical protein